MPKVDILTHLVQAAECRGVKVLDRGNGHFQLQGPHLLVNYYPLSKNRTAYVAGTKEGIPNCDVQRAVAMARNAPKMADNRDSRPNNSRAVRFKLLRGRKMVKCYWCPTMIDIDTSTLEHIIPLARGGLDNDNNRTLACKDCNGGRGHDMPELKQWPAPVDESSTSTLYGRVVTEEEFRAALAPPADTSPPWD